MLTETRKRGKESEGEEDEKAHPSLSPSTSQQQQQNSTTLSAPAFPLRDHLSRRIPLRLVPRRLAQIDPPRQRRGLYRVRLPRQET